MRAGALLLAVFVSACGAPTVAPDAGPVEADAGRYVPTESRLLGLNDVTWLLPLPTRDAGSGFPPATSMIPRASFDRISTTPGDVVTDLSRLELVGLRFDLCDRPTVAPCAEGSDGVLRLVLQPLFNDASAEDIAFHAFYPIPAADLGPVVDSLRAMARLQAVPRGSSLRVNTALGRDPLYTEALTGLVRRYARQERLFRLTLFGQLTTNSALIWVFRGLERRGAGFERIVIPDVRDLDQIALLFSSTEFQVRPQADAPGGFARLMNTSLFRAATPAEQREALETSAAIDNPTLHTAETVQCVSCHVTTTILEDRAMRAGVDPSSLLRRYRSSTFDLTPLGDPMARFRTMRALGWLQRAPLIAQRTVNETANVIDEIEARFPPAP